MARMRLFSVTTSTKSHKPRGLSRAVEAGGRITKRTSRGLDLYLVAWTTTLRLVVQTLGPCHFATSASTSGACVRSDRCTDEPHYLTPARPWDAGRGVGRRGRDRRWRRREEAEGDGDGLGRDRRAKKYRSGLPKEVGAPEPGIRRNSDLLTPQGKDLNPWYLKTGLTATAVSILTRSGLSSRRCR